MRAKDLKEGVEYLYRDYGAIRSFVRIIKIGRFRSLCELGNNRLGYKWNHRIVMSYKDYRNITRRIGGE